MMSKWDYLVEKLRRLGNYLSTEHNDNLAQNTCEEGIDVISALEEENDMLKFVISKFEGWYSETGCPLTETKESFCPCIDELKKDYDAEMDGVDEQDRFPFSPEDECEHSDIAGWCYARYYEKLFKDKQSLKGDK